MPQDTFESTAERTKLVHEQVFAAMQNAASTTMNVFAEPETIVVTVSWDPSLGDSLPVGFLANRKGEKIGPDTVLRAVRQLGRMQETLLRSIDRQIAQRQQVIEQQEKEIHGRKEQSSQGA